MKYFRFKAVFAMFICAVMVWQVTAYAMPADISEAHATTVITTEKTTTAKKLTIEQQAQIILDTMTTEEKVGQLFLAYIPAKNATAVQKKYQFGGYVLFANNFKNGSVSQKKKYIAGYQKASKVKMLISVDEEGGTVNRISRYKQYRKTPFKSPRNVYKSGGYKAITDDTKSKCKLMKSMGINTNLAPVADTAYKKSNFMYQRSFSTSAKSTSKYVKTVVKQMNSSKTVSTLKHFPGYGNNGDTHQKIIKDKRSLKTFKSRDLLPFSAGIDQGAPMIMVSHNIVTAFDKKNPASLSKKVHKYLRKDMGFDGVIVTDGLEMKGVADFVGGNSGEVAVRAVLAGNDMLCTSSYKTQYPAVLKAVKSGRIKMSQVDESVMRILEMKLKYGIQPQVK